MELDDLTDGERNILRTLTKQWAYGAATSAEDRNRWLGIADTFAPPKRPTHRLTEGDLVIQREYVTKNAEGQDVVLLVGGRLPICEVLTVYEDDKVRLLPGAWHTKHSLYVGAEGLVRVVVSQGRSAVRLHTGEELFTPSSWMV